MVIDSFHINPKDCITKSIRDDLAARLQAIADVKAHKFQRICSPGEWKVWRKGGRVYMEIMA